MAIPYAEAAEQVRTLARTFQSVIDLAAALDSVASIEQAAAEATARLDAVRSAIADAEQAAIDAQARAVSAADGAAQTVSAAQSVAASIVSDAHETAQAIIDRATADDSVSRAAILDRERAAAESLAQANALLQQRQAEIADLDARITQARATVAAMLGAAG